MQPTVRKLFEVLKPSLSLQGIYKVRSVGYIGISERQTMLHHPCLVQLSESVTLGALLSSFTGPRYRPSDRRGLVSFRHRRSKWQTWLAAPEFCRKDAEYSTMENFEEWLTLSFQSLGCDAMRVQRSLLPPLLVRCLGSLGAELYIIFFGQTIM